MSQHDSRRRAIKNIVMGSVAVGALSSFSEKESSKKDKPAKLKGNINHSVCRWCYQSIPLEDFCKSVKDMGMPAIDLAGPADWPMLQKYGLYSSMCYSIDASLGIPKGWNDKQYHASLIKNYNDSIELTAKNGYKQIICFSGNRNGMDDETGLKNCAEGLKQIMAQAEKHKITIVMELLNSKVDHKDYMCDKTPWGVELVKRVGSENFKLLYDIYHMQIDEGDVIRTINNNHQYISHYHTGGVPGRREIDETQELFYPAIMQAIIKTGFKGFVAQEFIPSWQDKIAALKKGVEICDV